MGFTASSGAISRLAAAALWVLALWNVAAYRGLYWDGSGLLALMIDSGWFHWVFYPARAHVMWLTQAPVIAALGLGVDDTSILAICYSAGLFAFPTAVYHLALWRTRHDPLALALVLVMIAAVYLPTSFFIISEFHAAAAVMIAGMAVVATSPRLTIGEGVLLVGLGLIAVRSYEVMIHLGILMAVAIAWRTVKSADAPVAARLLGWLAAALYLGASVMSGSTLAEYWLHPHFQSFRAGVGKFWENLQFTLALVTVLPLLGVLLVRPEFLRRWPIYALSAVPMVLLAFSAVLHHVVPTTVIHASSHYVARASAGLLLLALLAGWFLHLAWPGLTPRISAVLSDRAAASRLSLVALGFLLAAIVPDLALTSRWSGYLRTVQSIVHGGTGRIVVADTVLIQNHHQAFSQDWSYPAFSLLLRDAPSNAVLVVPMSNYGTPWNLNPDIRLPPLEGYAWRR